MTVYVQIEAGKAVASTKNIKIAQSVFKKFIETEFEDYIPSSIKYTFDGKNIIINPDYEKELEQQAKQQRKAEILDELDKIDLKTIRAIRANDTEFIEKFEKESEILREELRGLE